MSRYGSRTEFESSTPQTREPESPRHGFQGERLPQPCSAVPASLTVAVSREAGARGATIARRVGRKLGWQVYNQELLDYIAHEAPVFEGVTGGLLPEARAWCEERLHEVMRDNDFTGHPELIDQARLLLALAVQGNVVLVGRGAGLLVPPSTTLHVRVVAPLDDRIAYMSQWLRLTVEEAAEQVRLRDQRRAEFFRTHYRREPADIYQYDLVLNSSLLGEELCVELIVQAARAKLAALGPAADALL
jgi:cytidylate kinase